MVQIYVPDSSISDLQKLLNSVLAEIELVKPKGFSELVLPKRYHFNSKIVHRPCVSDEFIVREVNKLGVFVHDTQEANLVIFQW